MPVLSRTSAGGRQVSSGPATPRAGHTTSMRDGVNSSGTYPLSGPCVINVNVYKVAFESPLTQEWMDVDVNIPYVQRMRVRRRRVRRRTVSRRQRRRRRSSLGTQGRRPAGRRGSKRHANGAASRSRIRRWPCVLCERTRVVILLWARTRGERG